MKKFLIGIIAAVLISVGFAAPVQAAINCSVAAPYFNTKTRKVDLLTQWGGHYTGRPFSWIVYYEYSSIHHGPAEVYQPYGRATTVIAPVSVNYISQVRGWYAGTECKRWVERGTPGGL